MNFSDVSALRVELERRGVHLERRGEKLVCLPKGAAGELLPDIARFKPALLELLGAVCVDQNGEEVTLLTGPDADFRAWHWRACGAPFSFGFYVDWKQFARVHCSHFGGAAQLHPQDVATVALAILAAQRAGAGLDFERARLPWRVAEHLAGRAFDSPSLLMWARDVLESDAT